MEITCKINIEKVLLATKYANDILQNEDFYERISNKDSFDMSDATPKQISRFLKESDLEFVVKPFKPRGIANKIKYRKTLALTDRRYPNTLFLNVNKLNREAESIAATIIHESIHALDNSVKEFSFGHGDNDASGKGNTAPWWIGNQTYKILKNNNEAGNLDFTGIQEGFIS